MFSAKNSLHVYLASWLKKKNWAPEIGTAGKHESLELAELSVRFFVLSLPAAMIFMFLSVRRHRRCRIRRMEVSVWAASLLRGLLDSSGVHRPVASLPRWALSALLSFPSSPTSSCAGFFVNPRFLPAPSDSSFVASSFTVQLGIFIIIIII